MGLMSELSADYAENVKQCFECQYTALLNQLVSQLICNSILEIHIVIVVVKHIVKT